MEDSRKKTLIIKLTERVDSEVAGSSSDKVFWLVTHLEQYLERWIGFARLENIEVALALHNELFYVVLAAVAVTDSQITQLDNSISFPQEEWGHFKSSLEWIQKTPEKSELNLIDEMFEKFLLKLR